MIRMKSNTNLISLYILYTPIFVHYRLRLIFLFQSFNLNKKDKVCCKLKLLLLDFYWFKSSYGPFISYVGEGVGDSLAKAPFLLRAHNKHILFKDPPLISIKITSEILLFDCFLSFWFLKFLEKLKK